MGKIKGITVKLHVKTYDGDDNFGNPIYTEELVDVADVLVTPTSAEDSALFSIFPSPLSFFYVLCICSWCQFSFLDGSTLLRFPLQSGSGG